MSAFVSSFMAECWDILEALTCISFLPCGDFLIVSDSQASILAIFSNPFHLEMLPHNSKNLCITTIPQNQVILHLIPMGSRAYRHKW